MTATFTTKDDKLFIDGHEVIKGWESFSGWYWFATEQPTIQDSVLENNVIYKGDKIYFGYVQGMECEWGSFAESDLMPLINEGKVWRIKPQDLPHSGRRGDRA